MKAVIASVVCLAGISAAFAGTQTKISFTLNTTDDNGAHVSQNRYYWVYRPTGLALATPVPMMLELECSPNGTPVTFMNAKADAAGFVVVSCSFSGNSTGTPGRGWTAGNPRAAGWEDIDYLTEVIHQVAASDNCNDAFITGISKGGHMTMAYACERPAMIRAAGPMDEFMGLTSNLPTAPVPLIMFHGTADTNVPYTMVKDSVDRWIANNGLQNAVPVTTQEASPLILGNVTQTTWRGGINGTQVAFVTIIGGTHAIPVPRAQTGYNSADGLWAFFSQYLTPAQAAPKLVSKPAANVQVTGQPASFRAVATGKPPMTYQWQKNDVDIPGATADWYTTPPTTSADNGATFRVIATNASGSVTSDPATLTVNAAPAGPAITAAPVNQTVAAGQSVTFGVTATGGGSMTYQWQKNGINIAGATASSLTLNAITSDNGATFRVVVTDSAGSTTSPRATLAVLPAADAPVMVTYVAPEHLTSGGFEACLR